MTRLWGFMFRPVFVFRRLSYRRFTLVLSLLFVAGASVRAFGFFPEYEHFSESESFEIQSPQWIESEYASDVLTYTLPMEAYGNWLGSTSAFQYSAGSLGPTRFLIRGRLKFEQTLSEDLFFRLAFLDMADFERNRQSLVFEFGYRLFPNWSLHLYGQPESLKRKDDVGVAMEWGAGSNTRLRIFHTWVDFSHNKRNEDSDIYTKKPTSYGIVWRKLKNTGGFREWSFRNDGNLERRFFDTDRVYTYAGAFFSGIERWTLGPQRGYLQLQVDAARVREGDTVITDSLTEGWDLRRGRFWVQYGNGAQRLSLWGLKVSHYHWVSDEGSVVHNSVIPHLWLDIWEGTESGESRSLFQLGYEMTWHRGRGPAVFRSLNDFNTRSDHRLNLRYQIDFANQTALVFLGTVDCDQLIESPWEGGNIQFTTKF